MTTAGLSGVVCAKVPGYMGRHYDREGSAARVVVRGLEQRGEERVGDDRVARAGGVEPVGGEQRAVRGEGARRPLVGVGQAAPGVEHRLDLALAQPVAGGADD